MKLNEMKVDVVTYSKTAGKGLPIHQIAVTDNQANKMFARCFWSVKEAIKFFGTVPKDIDTRYQVFGRRGISEFNYRTYLDFVGEIEAQKLKQTEKDETGHFGAPSLVKEISPMSPIGTPMNQWL